METNVYQTVQRYMNKHNLDLTKAYNKLTDETGRRRYHYRNLLRQWESRRYISDVDPELVKTVGGDLLIVLAEKTAEHTKTYQEAWNMTKADFQPFVHMYANGCISPELMEMVKDAVKKFETEGVYY